MTVPIITVDGPSGSGKGTLSQRVAQQLGWHYLDSGALYRVLALAAQQHRVALDNEAALELLAQQLDVKFITDADAAAVQVNLAGADVTDQIRDEACGNAASKIAVFSAVRAALVDRQRAFAQAPGLVTDGRDMGSVIFPEAQLKLFLVASRQERAQRRYNQLKEKGINVSLQQILCKIEARDARDKQRTVAPLRPALDAVIIDTTNLGIDAVFTRVMEEVSAQFAVKMC